MYPGYLCTNGVYQKYISVHDISRTTADIMYAPAFNVSPKGNLNPVFYRVNSVKDNVPPLTAHAIDYRLLEYSMNM